jgi:hypothetical protein
VRLLVDATVNHDLPHGLRTLRQVQASHVGEHGFLRAADELIVPYATRHRMILLTNDTGISARRFPICTHAGVIVVDIAWRDPAGILARLRILWRSGLRSRLPHSVTTIDDEGVKILGPDPTQRQPDVFVIRPNWFARGARLMRPPVSRTAVG